MKLLTAILWKSAATAVSPHVKSNTLLQTKLKVKHKSLNVSEIHYKLNCRDHHEEKLDLL